MLTSGFDDKSSKRIARAVRAIEALKPPPRQAAPRRQTITNTPMMHFVRVIDLTPVRGETPVAEQVAATAAATLSGSAVSSVAITAHGSGYVTAPLVSFEGACTTAATATATVSGGIVTRITLTSGGEGYTDPPTVLISSSADTDDADAGDPTMEDPTVGELRYKGKWESYAAADGDTDLFPDGDDFVWIVMRGIAPKLGTAYLARRVGDDPATGIAIYRVCDDPNNHVLRARVYTEKLPTYTRTGNEITGTVNGPLIAQDGISLALGDKLLYNPYAAATGPAWVVSTDYLTGDYVAHNGVNYTAIQDNVGIEPDVTASWADYWEAIAPAWGSGDEYEIGDFVTHTIAGLTRNYVCIQDNTADATTEPGEGGSWSSYWVDGADAGLYAVTRIGGSDPPWVDGKAYGTGDVIAVGLQAYQALTDHVADADNQPGVGVNWEAYWSLTSGTSEPYTLERTTDASTSGLVHAGVLVEIGPEGPLHGNTLWQLVTPDVPTSIVLNETAITFADVCERAQVIVLASAGDGWDATTTTAITVPITPAAPLTVTVDAKLKLRQGDTIKFTDTVNGNVVWGLVYTYSGTSLTLLQSHIASLTIVPGTYSSWTGQVTRVQGYWPAKLLGRDLKAAADIWARLPVRPGPLSDLPTLSGLLDAGSAGSNIPIVNELADLPNFTYLYEAVRTNGVMGRSCYTINPPPATKQVTPSSGGILRFCSYQDQSSFSRPFYYESTVANPIQNLISFPTWGNDPAGDNTPTILTSFLAVCFSEALSIPVFTAVDLQPATPQNGGVWLDGMIDQHNGTPTETDALGVVTPFTCTILSRSFGDDSSIPLAAGGTGIKDHLASGRSFFLGYGRNAELASNNTESALEKVTASVRGYSPGIAPAGDYLIITRATWAGGSYVVNEWSQVAIIHGTGQSTIVARGGTGTAGLGTGTWQTQFAVATRDAAGAETVWSGASGSDVAGNTFKGGLFISAGTSTDFRNAVKAALAALGGLPAGTY